MKRQSRKLQILLILSMSLTPVLMNASFHLPPTRYGSSPSSQVVEGTAQQFDTGPVLSLEDLEEMARLHSPTLAQATAGIRAARGRTIQAGLYPNPKIGYIAEEVSTGPVIRGGEHGFFVEQEIVLGGKLKIKRRLFEKEEQGAETEAETQKYRVLNAVRLLYYQALAAERLVELRRDFLQLASQGANTVQQLYNVGRANQPEVLEAEVTSRRAELAFAEAQNDRERIWRELAAVVGVPSLPAKPLAGSLDTPAPDFQFSGVLQTLLQESPEIMGAQLGLARAERVLQQARAERIPNLLVRGGLTNNRELLEAGGKPVGLEAFGEVSARIPLFDRNEGNIEAAQADLERARLELERVKLSLQARLAVAYKNYRNAVALVEKYRGQVLPDTQRTCDVYLSGNQEMAPAYPQLLIPQQTCFQLRVDYVAAQENMWRTVAEIRGLLLFD